MARKNKNDDVVLGLSCAVFVAFIMLLVFAATVAAIVYAAIITCILLGYCFYSPHTQQEDIDSFHKSLKTYKACTNRYYHVINEYADLHITQKGRYDERSYRGKQANIDRNNAETNKHHAEKNLHSSMESHTWGYFFRATALGLITSYAILTLLTDISPFTSYILSAFLSIIPGLATKHYITDAATASGTLPFLKQKTSLVIFALWVLAGIPMISAMTQTETVAIPMVQSTTEQPAPTAEREKPSVRKTPSKVQPVIEQTIIPYIQEKTGFVSAESISPLSPQGGKIDRLPLKKGTEVIITGESRDKKLLELRTASDPTKVYVPVEFIAIFND